MSPLLVLGIAAVATWFVAALYFQFNAWKRRRAEDELAYQRGLELLAGFRSGPCANDTAPPEETENESSAPPVDEGDEMRRSRAEGGAK